MQPEQPNTPKRQIKLEMGKDLTATYANTVMISHTPNELFFDFIQLVPQDPRARVLDRVVMSPVHAKMFLQALTENIRRFEDKHGEIDLPQRPSSLADELFKNISPGDENNDNG